MEQLPNEIGLPISAESPSSLHRFACAISLQSAKPTMSSNSPTETKISTDSATTSSIGSVVTTTSGVSSVVSPSSSSSSSGAVSVQPPLTAASVHPLASAFLSSLQLPSSPIAESKLPIRQRRRSRSPLRTKRVVKKKDRSRAARTRSRSASPGGGLRAHDHYFLIMKSNCTENIVISMREQVWSTSPKNSSLLNRVYQSGSAVYLFFTVMSSDRFCGAATLQSSLDPHRKVAWKAGTGSWRGAFNIKWIYKRDLLFSALPLSGKKNPAHCYNGHVLSVTFGTYILSAFEHQPLRSYIPKVEVA